MESVLFNLCEVRFNLEALRKAGIDVNRLRAVGGGIKSARWMQLKANITGIPIETLKVSEAGCLGAAFLAGQGIGIFESPEDILQIAVADWVFEPRTDVFQQYEDSYRKYQEILSRVKELVL